MALIAFRLHPNFQFPVLCHADGRAKTFANRAQAQAAALTPRWKRLAIPARSGIFRAGRRTLSHSHSWTNR